MLRLETKTKPLVVNLAGFPGDASIQFVSGEKLKSRLRCRNVECAARRWIDEAYGMKQTVGFAVQDEVVIVAETVANLFIIGIDSRADSRGLPKIEGRAVDWRESGGRDHRRIDGRVAIGINGDDVVGDVAFAVTGEIEIRMLREIDRSGLICRRMVIDDQFV